MIDKVINESSKRITNHYQNKNHTGVDLGWRNNEEENKVYAHSDGIVTKAIDGKNKNIGSTGLESYGNYIEIEHPYGYKTRYAHLQKNSILVKKGDKVNANTQIGVIGDSGNAFGRHLHLEIFKDNKRINPEKYLIDEFSLNNYTYQAHDSKYDWNPNVVIGTDEYAGNFGISIDAIYLDNYEIRVHDKKQNEWLPWVKNRNDYAGNMGHPIDGVQIKNVRYRVHIKKGNWLDWIDKVDNTSNGYAGIYGKEIDAIQIQPKKEE